MSDTKIENISIPLSDEFYNELREVEESPVTRAQFVHNFGVLLSQTRERVLGLKYRQSIDNLEYADIYYKGGKIQAVNITYDSWLSIIQDVLKEFNY